MKKAIYYIIGSIISLIFILSFLTDIPSANISSIQSYKLKNNEVIAYGTNETIKGYRVNLSDSTVSFGKLNPTSFIKTVKIVEDDTHGDLDEDFKDENLSNDDLIDYNYRYNEVTNGYAKGYNKSTGELVEIEVAKAYNKHVGSLKNPLDSKNMKVSSPFGVREDPFGEVTEQGSLPFHTGLDLAATGISGDNIYSVAKGKIDTIQQSDSGYGNLVVVNYGEFDILYAHMSKTNEKLREGDIVEAGQVLGQVGTTGRSTGPHLHIEIVFGDVAVSPETLLSLVGKGYEDQLPDRETNPGKEREDEDKDEKDNGNGNEKEKDKGVENPKKENPTDQDKALGLTPIPKFTFPPKESKPEPKTEFEVEEGLEDKEDKEDDKENESKEKKSTVKK